MRRGEGKTPDEHLARLSQEAAEINSNGSENAGNDAFTTANQPIENFGQDSSNLQDPANIRARRQHPLAQSFIPGTTRAIRPGALIPLARPQQSQQATAFPRITLRFPVTVARANNFEIDSQNKAQSDVSQHTSTLSGPHQPASAFLADMTSSSPHSAPSAGPRSLRSASSPASHLEAATESAISRKRVAESQDADQARKKRVAIGAAPIKVRPASAYAQAVEEPEGMEKNVGDFCLTCIRYGRDYGKKTKLDIGSNGHKRCLECKEPGKGSGSRICRWVDKSQGILTYEDAQRIQKARRLRQNTREGRLERQGDLNASSPSGSTPAGTLTTVSTPATTDDASAAVTPAVSTHAFTHVPSPTPLFPILERDVSVRPFVHDGLSSPFIGDDSTGRAGVIERLEETSFGEIVMSAHNTLVQVLARRVGLTPETMSVEQRHVTEEMIHDSLAADSGTRGSISGLDDNVRRTMAMQAADQMELLSTLIPEEAESGEEIIGLAEEDEEVGFDRSAEEERAREWFPEQELGGEQNVDSKGRM